MLSQYSEFVKVNFCAAKVSVDFRNVNNNMYRCMYRLLWQAPPLFGEGITVGDLTGDGTLEIAATISAPASKNDGELYDQFVILEKRHELYTIAWKSPPFGGKIVNLKIDDADNDDRDELILCLRNRSGRQIRLYAATRSSN